MCVKMSNLWPAVRMDHRIEKSWGNRGILSFQNEQQLAAKRWVLGSGTTAPKDGDKGSSNDPDGQVSASLIVLQGNNIFMPNRSLLYNGEPNIQAWGVISLLLAKVVGHTKDPGTGEDSILQRQRLLAEICEMIRVAFLIHQVRWLWKPLAWWAK